MPSGIYALDIYISSVSGNPNISTWLSLYIASSLLSGSSGFDVITDHSAIPPETKVNKHYTAIFAVDSSGNKSFNFTIGFHQSKITINLNILVRIYRLG